MNDNNNISNINNSRSNLNIKNIVSSFIFKKKWLWYIVIAVFIYILIIALGLFVAHKWLKSFLEKIIITYAFLGLFFLLHYGIHFVTNYIFRHVSTDKERPLLPLFPERLWAVIFTIAFAWGVLYGFLNFFPISKCAPLSIQTSLQSYDVVNMCTSVSIVVYVCATVIVLGSLWAIARIIGER